MSNIYIEEVRKNDLRAIKESIKKYLEKQITLMELVQNIEMLAESSFNESDMETLYSFLINKIGDLEIEYFMKADEVTNDDYYNYREELIEMVKDFQKELEKYKMETL